jgi:hypothetical protein
MYQERKPRFVSSGYKWRLHSGALILLLTTTSASGAKANDEPSVQAAVLSSGSITLDRRLEEPIWREAPLLKLTQQSPKPGEPTKFETEVRVVVAGDRVYFGFLCKDPELRRIAVHTMRRDALMTGDDTVSIVFDTYGDHRTGYFFQINAAGTLAIAVDDQAGERFVRGLEPRLAAHRDGPTGEPSSTERPDRDQTALDVSPVD